MKPILKVETYTSESLPHEPVITNKTWQEELKDGFYKEFGSFHAPCNLENTPKSEIDDWEILNYCEQFISDLRKRDMEAMLKITDDYYDGEGIEDWNKRLQLIQDYYEK